MKICPQTVETPCEEIKWFLKAQLFKDILEHYIFYIVVIVHYTGINFHDASTVESIWHLFLCLIISVIEMNKFLKFKLVDIFLYSQLYR